MQKRYYIAYGSNLNVRQMRWRCPDARIIGTAERAEGYSVPVAVWEVSAADEVKLDRYEGYPAFYYKKEMTIDFAGIRTGRKRRRRVFVYIMHEERPVSVPSRGYVMTCLEGYHDFGFNSRVLTEAYDHSKEAAEDEG